MRFHQREYPVARSIRPVLLAALPHHLHPVGDAEPDHRRAIDLPFAPVTVSPSPPGIAALVAACDIDHGVAPSPTIRGGMRAARARLDRFVETGLPRYEEQRGDPNVDGTSRLSPYLHFGNISIQEVLLTARRAGAGDNYARFQDEALTWRELAHNLVHFNPRHRTLYAIQDWARRELDDHSSHPRPVLYNDEDLELARTHDDAWTA
jgi:deoxyribodipyrimidine photo-lyase